MGVFTNSLKTFTSDITGEKKSYKINNAVWLFMQADYGIKQGDWIGELEKNEVLSLAKFATSILKANKIDTSLEEVLENTDMISLSEFVNVYGNLSLGIEDVDTSEKKTE